MDEILKRMDALVEAADGQPMTDEALAEYEGLEAQLKRAEKTEELVKRQAAYRRPATAIVTGTAVDDAAELNRSFAQYLRTGRADDGLLQRAQSEGVGSAGGYLVAPEFRAIIIERMKAFGGVRSGATVISTATGAALPWLTNDDTSNLGAVSTEAGSLGSGADLVFGTKVLNSYVYTSNGASSLPLKVSYELLQDSAFDLPGFIGRKLGERIARKMATDLVNGTGAGEPTGLLSAAGGLSTGTQFSSNTTPVYGDLVNQVHSVDPAYRDGCVWLFNDGFLKVLRKVVDSTGRPILWDYSMNASVGLTGMTLLGYPVIVDQACPDPSSGNNFGFFGNLAETYVIRDVKDMSVVVLNELYATTRQVGYMAWARMDATVQNTNSGVLLKAA